MLCHARKDRLARLGWPAAGTISLMAQRRGTRAYLVYDVHTDQKIGVLGEKEYQRYLADLRVLSKGYPCKGLDGAAFGFPGKLIDVPDARAELRGPAWDPPVIHYAGADEPCAARREGQPQGPLLVANCSRCLSTVGKKHGTALFESSSRDTRVEVVHLADGSMYDIPFNAEFKDSLKAAVPREGRRWFDAMRKWFIVAEYQSCVETLLERYFGKPSREHALHLLALTSSATPGQIYVSWQMRRQVGGTAACELDKCIEVLSAHYGDEFVALARAELAALVIPDSE